MPKQKRKQSTRQAVAVQYQDVDQLPRVVASGSGEIANKIVEIAKQNNIPLHQDDLLVELLSKVQVGAVISPETYKYVAEIICFLYQVDKQWRTKHAQLESLIKLDDQDTTSANP